MKYNVQNLYNSHFIPTIDGGVLKSDNCIPLEVKQKLLSSTKRLDQAAMHKSKETLIDLVMDIVDPFLFPLSFERTRMLRFETIAPQDCIRRYGDGETVRVIPSHEECVQKDRSKYPNDMAWSRRFQWLPFDIKFAAGGEGASWWVPL